MNLQFKRTEIANRVFFNSVSDTKFKYNRMSVMFVTPLNEKDAANFAVVPFLLRRGYAECPDFAKLNEKLDRLYGAVLDADVVKLGAYQALIISIKSLDDRYAIAGEQILADCAQLICDIVLSPNFVNGAFTEENTALERQNIIDTIDAQLNDKRTYAINQCIAAMCKDTPYAVSRYGSRESAEQITPQSATNAYHKLLQSAEIEIMFTGCGDSEKSKQIFADRFAVVQRSTAQAIAVSQRIPPKKVNTINESMDITQGKMVMGFYVTPFENYKQIVAAKVMTALYGGTPTSRLFVNVREKLQLCYYCAARTDALSNFLLVDSGVEQENMEKAKTEILNQLSIVQNDKFTEEDYQYTILAVKNALRSVTDSLEGIESWYFQQILLSSQVAPAQEAEMLDNITREDVVNAAKAVTLDTVYLLTGRKE